MMKLNQYYQERGIKKYMGFYLSEHTRELKKDQEANSKINLGLEMMSFREVTEIIEISLSKNLPVSIQPNIKRIDGHGFDDNITGLIAGYSGDLLYIDETCISLNLIRHISLIEPSKWYPKEVNLSAN